MVMFINNKICSSTCLRPLSTVVNCHSVMLQLHVFASFVCTCFLIARGLNMSTQLNLSVFYVNAVYF